MVVGLIFLIVGIVLMIGILIIGIGFWMFQKDISKEHPTYIVQFMKKNLTNKNVSIQIQYNDEEWVKVNEDNPLPLASTVKIIIAIEYAKQVANGQLHADELISFDELTRFYLPKTDGGAHMAWKQLFEGKTHVPLHEVAKGMIMYSSNANTEYLINRLGIEQINNTLYSLNLQHHEEIYPYVSAMVLPAKLMAELNKTKKDVIKELCLMHQETYINEIMNIYEELKSQPLTDTQKDRVLKQLPIDIQRIWSDRFTKASVSDYISILKKLNSKSYFTEQIHTYLDSIMEYLMENPKNQEWLQYAGQKGGSTAFVCTQAFYAKDKQNNTMEFAFFANDLSPLEQAKLTKNINSFQREFLKDKSFREHVKSELTYQ